MCGLCTSATSKAVPCICIDLALTCSKAVCSLLECVCKASSCAAETSDLLKDWSSMLLCDSTAPLQTCPLSMSNTHACRQGSEWQAQQRFTSAWSTQTAGISIVLSWAVKSYSAYRHTQHILYQSRSGRHTGHQAQRCSCQKQTHQLLHD